MHKVFRRLLTELAMPSSLRKPTWKVAARRLLEGLGELSQAGLDFIYPPACLSCRGGISADAHPHFCAACQADLAPLILDACQRCSAPVGPNLDTSQGCVHCRSTPFHFRRAISLGVYQRTLRGACLLAKHRGTEPLIHGLAELHWSRHGSELESLHIDRVLSVPQHWTTRIWRGHNASECLARFFARRLAAKFDNRRVRKVRRTPQQKSLPSSERKRNLRDAFELRRPRSLQGERILLVDDVLTTGTTVNRISRLLKQVNVASIHVAVIALGLGDAR